MPHQIHTTEENATLVTAEVAELLAKGAIVETHPTPDNYVSLVEKKDGGQRPVINLKGHFKMEHFKMEPICEDGALQDGGPSPPSRPPPSRRLDGQNGPEGCIPAGPNPPRPSIISHLPMGAEMVQIHLSTIRPVICTEGLHQTNKASSGLPKAGGLSPNNIPG